MSLDETFRLLVREEVRLALQEALHPELLTPTQAGELAGCSAKTIRAWLKVEKLRRYGEGRPLVSRKELLALLAEPKAQRRPLERVPSAEAEARRLRGTG